MQIHASSHPISSKFQCTQEMCKKILFRFATKAGVNLMTFDNEEELHKIKYINPSAKLVLRILADDPTAICNVRFCGKAVCLCL